MKIQDLPTNDSSFIELDLNEAADVGGGNGWYPNLSDEIFYDSLGSDTVAAHYLGQNRNRYTPEATLANGINSDSLGAFDRRFTGTLGPLRMNGISI
jgi:hypothetical protein